MKKFFYMIATAALCLSCTNNVGTAEAYWLCDTARDFPVSTFPAADSATVAELGLEAGVPGSMNAVLVKTGKNNLLFDSAMGLKLVENLNANGVTPEDIDYIYITHLHGDHIGGLVKDGQVVFPNATVFISQPEYDYWSNLEGQGGAAQFLDLYKDQIQLFELGDELPGGVQSINAVGHTPGHAAYRVGDILLVGDIMHGVALQMKNLQVNAAFDNNQEDAANTRVRMIEYAKENNLVMYGMHFPDPGFIDFR